MLARARGFRIDQETKGKTRIKAPQPNQNSIPQGKNMIKKTSKQQADDKLIEAEPNLKTKARHQINFKNTNITPQRRPLEEQKLLQIKQKETTQPTSSDGQLGFQGYQQNI